MIITYKIETRIYKIYKEEFLNAVTFGTRDHRIKLRKQRRQKLLEVSFTNSGRRLEPVK